eukprot:CAMPEP_0205832802 /NCGR_PEP_ID=MMETSP0206-20130828/47934_1 /ASSEMBLY_ACC=CAM_ASM_000279 /TAXON_ID=36767 /ORGANISM="Euplotes focardii, Strain TN1" /LENGTH=129 /DNA_ID=CAMNT_0053138647 /DNA_START=205 /DNA_END=595 /DNA_ORIENTATION=-
MIEDLMATKDDSPALKPALERKRKNPVPDIKGMILKVYRELKKNSNVVISQELREIEVSIMEFLGEDHNMLEFLKMEDTGKPSLMWANIRSILVPSAEKKKQHLCMTFMLLVFMDSMQGLILSIKAKKY